MSSVMFFSSYLLIGHCSVVIMCNRLIISPLVLALVPYI